MIIRTWIVMKQFAATSFLLLVLFLSGSLARAEAGRFEVFGFHFPGRVMEVITEDVDGDGLVDLLALHMDPSRTPVRRLLTVVFQDAAGGFQNPRRVEWEIPAEVAALDLGDVGLSPGRELVAITERGVSAGPIRPEGIGPLTPLLTAQSVVAIPSKRNVPYYNFVWDYTGDGRDDVLVCGFYGSILARQEDGYTFTTQELNLRPEIDLFAFDISALMSSPDHPVFRVAYQVPQVYSEDYNADGRPDLIAAFFDEIQVYAQGPDGFAQSPTERWRVELFSREDNREGPPPSFDFGDIDHDGKIDVVASHLKGNLGSITSRAVLYWGKSDNITRGKPDIEFQPPSTVMGKIIIWDVNGDDLEDLIMPTYNISPLNIGKIFVTGEITVEWAYFIQQDGHTFHTTPDRTITTNMKVNLRKFRLESGIPNIIGDFNGDRFPDQAMGESEDVLAITLRDIEGKPLDPVEKVAVAVSPFFRAVDLNHDGLSDLILYYIDTEDRRGDVNVLLNRGPWPKAGEDPP